MISRFGQAGVRAATGAALGIAGLFVLTPAAAHAATPMHRDAAADELPPVGEQVDEPLDSDLVFTVNGRQCHAHVAGSIEEDVIAQDRADETDTLEETGLRLRGPEACDFGSEQAREGGGAVTIEQNDIDVDAKSLLRLTQQFPPKYEQIMVLSFTMTIDQPEGASNNQAREGYEPLILTTKDPAKLIGQLTQFPPRGDLYRLQNPVDLVDLENPDVTVATIQKFPVKVGGL